MGTISDILLSRYPGEGRPATIRKHLGGVCDDFVRSGLADHKFKAEFAGNSDTSFWACMSEALVYRRLKGMTFPKRENVGIGPDFLLEVNGKRLWLEVICPSPVDIPDSWLEIQFDAATSMPHQEILLRWTSAIKEKTEKLVGCRDGIAEGYLQKGFVNHDDIYVVAVNGCRLRHGPFSAINGISQLPYAVEAVFPIGPLQIRLDRESLETIGSGHSYRSQILKPSGSSVPTCAFLDPWYSSVSAVWAIDFNGYSCIGNTEPSVVVHNPNATNPLPVGLLPADEDFIAKPVSEEVMEIDRIKRNVSI